MWFRSLLASCKSGVSGSRRKRSCPARRGTRLALEHLEDRSLPSSYSAATVSALIADINAANKAGGVNTITLTAPATSPYVLTTVNNASTTGTNPQGENGLPIIAANDNLTIVGNGDTIERGNVQAYFRLFDVASGGSLALDNLTITGGWAPGAGGTGGQNPAGPSNNAFAQAEGGAIYNQGTLVLNGVTFQNNRAEALAKSGTTAAGGAIFSYGGSVTLEGGTIVSNNSAIGTLGSYGGNAYGGGLCAVGSTVIVTQATLDNNIASGAGLGGIESYDGVAYGGGLYVSGGKLNLTNATLNGNAATAEYGAYGGGLFLFGGTTTLTNCTVQTNSANINSAPGDGQGGGIYIYAGTYAIGYQPGYVNTYVNLDAATVEQVTGNTASSGAAYDNIVGTYTLT